MSNATPVASLFQSEVMFLLKIMLIYDKLAGTPRVAELYRKIPNVM